MTDISIRLARSDELVQDLNHELFLSDQKHLGDLNVNWPYQEPGENYFRRMIDGDNGVCLVAEYQGSVIGYLAGTLHKEHPAYVGKRAELDNMCVTAKIRSKGADKLLVAAFYEWCSEQQVDYVIVNAFTPNNRALDFYASNGFEPYSTTLLHKLR